MAEVEEAVYAILTGDGGVAELAGSRVYPQRIPQGAALPAVAYARVSTRRVKSHGGSSGLARPRIQVNGTAASYQAAKALASAVRGALDGVRRTVVLDGQESVAVEGSWLETDGDEFGETDGLHSVRQDFMIWFGEV